MDSSPRDSRPQAARPVPTPNQAQTPSSLQNLQGGSGHGSDSGSGRNRPLRRGHSDGDVFGPPLRRPEGNRQTDEETWMDFLQQSSRALLQESSRPEGNTGISSLGGPIRSFGIQDAERRQERQASLQRAALVMADRKRRLTENQEDYNRRRSASSLPFGPPMKTPQESGGLPNRGHDITFASPGRASSSSIMDRSLPRRPDVASHRHRESRDIILPRWQPDSEVTRCPICKTAFGFWYRKHHCRKCGRVVCANCSPHRITIPRQFIVQPPQDEDRTTREGVLAGIEVVDLTEDDNAGVGAPRSSTENQDTPRSPHIRIDPALGGGQEVRLCNPCVPDPNPSPHLPLEAPNLSAIHSFPRLSFDSVGISGTSSSSTRHSFDRVQRSELDAGRGSSGSVLGGRTQDHDSSRYLSRHSSRLPPPNYTSLYGSVPISSPHEVTLTLCTCSDVSQKNLTA